MIPFARIVRLTFVSALVLLVMDGLAWAVFPGYRIYLAGYGFGLIFSILNGIILAVKTIQIKEFSLKQDGRKRSPGTGQLQRFLLAGFAGFVAIKYPSYFHLLSVIMGLTTVTAISLLISVFYYGTKNSTTTERG